MPNDAKVGFLVGLALFIAVAVVYFRSDNASKHEETPAATAAKPTPPSHQPPRGQTRPTKARPAVKADEHEPEDAEQRRYTVLEGDTLSNLAERFYGDKEKARVIYRANRNQLNGPDDLPAGTVLVIPRLPATNNDPSDEPGP